MFDKPDSQTISTILKTAWVQMNPMVGDIQGNLEQILAYVRLARKHQAKLIIFPELALTGYPPEDLLLRPSLVKRVNAALETLRKFIEDEWVILGAVYAQCQDTQSLAMHEAVPNLSNTAMLLNNQKLVGFYSKQILPNYQVFDEKRYFRAGNEVPIFEILGVKVALAICEDVWHSRIVEDAKTAGAELIISINASPFDQHKRLKRREILEKRFSESQLPIIYLNMVGGQDELVFDGGSCFLNADGQLNCILPYFEAGMGLVDIDTQFSQAHLIQYLPLVEETSYAKRAGLKPPNLIARFAALDEVLDEAHDEDVQESWVYRALVLGVRDYVHKNGFTGAVLGLSGGIDSALTLCVAVDALGPDVVTAIMMPYEYTSTISLEDAEKQAKTLGVEYLVKPIAPIYEQFAIALEDDFAGLPQDTTEENLQARCRGVLLMAMSNKFSSIVLTTGNKSEMAVGYATLYGDMAGGFDVLKDMPKTWVYRIARYLNEKSSLDVIPSRVIERPPSAELRPDQKDQDSLPDYDELDEILELYIAQDKSADEIIDAGFARDMVLDVIGKVDRNEYKRRQAPIGVRITPRAFGRDRRYPITFYWPPGE